MPPRRRPQPRAAEQRPSRRSARSQVKEEDAISVHSIADSSPEPEQEKQPGNGSANGRPQRRSMSRARSGASLIDGKSIRGDSATRGRAKQTGKRGKAVKTEAVVEAEPIHLISDDESGPSSRRQPSPTHAKVKQPAAVNEDDAMEDALEQVDVGAAGASASPATTVQGLQEEADEMDLEQVDTVNDAADGDEGEEDLDLEQVDAGDAGAAPDEDAGAYAAAYEAARAEHGGGEGAQPVFKDGKGQPGGINISLSAAAQRGKASPSSKRGPVVTTRDRTVRLATHKIMALALLAHARVRNELLNNDSLRDALYAIVPNNFLEKLRGIHPKKVPNQNERVRLMEAFLRELTKWWSYKFRLDPQLTALGALRQPDADLLAGQFPKAGRRVDGWVVETARQRQDRQREIRKADEERRRARKGREDDTARAASGSRRRKGKTRAQAEDGKVAEPTEKPAPRPPFPDITLFGIGNSTTPVYLRLAELRESTRTIDDLLDRLHAMSGSREISAQLFAALCRALGVPSRLVVSLQVPSWSIAAGKVAATSGASTPTKGGAIAKQRRAYDEKEAIRREQEKAVRRQTNSAYATSDAESFHDSDGHTSDERGSAMSGSRRRVAGKQGTRPSKPVSVASSPLTSEGESEHPPEKAPRASTRRAALVNGARRLAEKGNDKVKDAEQSGMSADESNAKPGKKSANGDTPREERKGLGKPREVVYVPKLRAQKPKPLKETEIAADTQPDISPVDIHAPPTMWVEVYSKPWQRWITIDPVRGLIEPTGNRQMEPVPNDKSNRLVYVVAFEEDGYARDVTARYTRTLHSRVSRMRPPPGKRNADGEAVDWWSRVMATLHRPQKLDRDAAEDLELEGAASREPMPSSVAAFKDHPVYAIEKHLKRDEVIHPYRQAGTFQGMPVFLRSNVLSLRSARQWYNEGRVVKEGEDALKWVKTRGYTLANKRAEEEARQQGAEGLQEGLYALFQTTLYQAPPIVDGEVPKNEFGNIDLFVDSMLPPGGAHIPFNGAAKVARKLNVPHAEAIVGFEFRKHRSMPRLSGIVVAAENHDVVLEAFWESEHMQAERDLQRRQERLFKNWKKLLNALKIQERIQREYGNADGADVSDGESAGQSNEKKGKAKRGKKRARAEDDEGEQDEDDMAAYESLHARGHEEQDAGEEEGGGFMVE